MKTKRELEEKEKKIRQALIKEEIKVFRKRYILFAGLIVLIIYYFVNLNSNHATYLSYNDSEVTAKYNELIENFNNLTRYHLQYKTSIVRGSLNYDIFYIKDNLYLERYSKGDEIKIRLFIPKREEMIIQTEGDNQDCNIIFKESQNKSKNYFPCTFNIGLPIENNSIPLNLNLERKHSTFSQGKIYLIEKNISGEEVLCFEEKIGVPFISPSFIFGLGKYIPRAIKPLQNLPKRIESSDYRCFTKKGVLVQTQKNEKFISIEYNFTNDILNELPLYSDFQKFSNTSLSNRTMYFKISIDDITTYFMDFKNYATLGSFDKTEYFISGCLNGTSLGLNRSCNFDISYSQEWANNVFYPIVYIGSKTIANQTADCFNYFYGEVNVMNVKEFCIIAGGYMVSESFVWQNKTISYEVTSILDSSEKEFNKEMAKAVYLSSKK